MWPKGAHVRRLQGLTGTTTVGNSDKWVQRKFLSVTLCLTLNQIRPLFSPLPLLYLSSDLDHSKSLKLACFLLYPLVAGPNCHCRPFDPVPVWPGLDALHPGAYLHPTPFINVETLISPIQICCPLNHQMTSLLFKKKTISQYFGPTMFGLCFMK